MKNLITSLTLFLFGLAATAQTETLLLREPAISATQVAFVYGGDIWIADKSGTNPSRLTVNPGVESNPYFSPDGQSIAFSGNYNGNTDVYVVSVKGGNPQRLTFHPTADLVRGWTPDGKRILFSSNALSAIGRYSKLFTVSATGDFPKELPLHAAYRGNYSNDGQAIAYTNLPEAYNTWKRYRGGQTPAIWITDLKNLETEEIKHLNASDVYPCWVGEKVYFLSDRNRIMNVFEYDRKSKAIKQLTQYQDFDVKTLKHNGSELVFEQGGKIHLMNLTTNQVSTLKISIMPDVLALRPSVRKVAGYIRHLGLSPTGLRAVVEARGDIYTIPAKKGDVRNLTQSNSTHERYPTWSPNGDKIAYLSDASGEYQLMIQDQKGEKPAEAISLGKANYYFAPTWSPDGKKLVYPDKSLNLWYIDLATKKPIKIDAEAYGPILDDNTMMTSWSADSRYIAYHKQMENHFHGIFIYDLQTNKSVQVSDGMSDATSPCFSRDGKYLVFTASTNYALNSHWLDMSSYERPVRRNLYLAVLSKKEASPFAPESDEEKAKEEKPEETAKKEESKKEEPKKDAKAEMVIDFEGIGQRIIPLPNIGTGDYDNIQCADGNKFFVKDGATLLRYDLKEKKSEMFFTGNNGYTISADGKKLLYNDGATQGIVETSGKPTAGEGKLNTANLEATIDPRKEWKQMFDELWRIERDYFYVANMHGVDWPATKKKYEAFLPHVAHRSDLNYLFAEMMGEMVVGHNYINGGDFPETKAVSIGMLGADFEVANGYYRFKKIYNGENWNPNLVAPLTQPGVNIATGEYLLAVNGRKLTANDNVYAFFENLAGKQTTLTVNTQASETGARQVVVVPVAAENALRMMDWVEGNRRKVAEMTKGKVAYVYLPNTGADGYNYFNRYYFSQLDKEAVIIDERYNGGGFVADYIIDLLNRPLLSYWAPREGQPFTSPGASIYGPKVMIANEYAGSGGDALPAFFKRRGLGTLVGKRTWGGLVGISGYPTLIDGGSVTSPSFGIYSPDGQWEIENVGVYPDIEVEMYPKTTQNGSDPQLEKAVEVILDELKKNPVKKVPIPNAPNRARE